MEIRKPVLVACLIAASAASAQNPFPPYHVERTKILLTGEPAPGIPGCTVASFLAPQIDGAGKVLIDGNISGPGVTAANNSAVWYGDENGLILVIREGDPAPGIPGAFVSEPWETYVSESGVLSLACYLTGASIVEGVNARGAFEGQLGALQKIVQAGDPAPFTEPGTVFASSFFWGVRLSDSGLILLIYDLSGPTIDSSNDRAMYVGYPDNPQLIWRRGMQAPGCEEGVVFAWADGVGFNDEEQVGFRGGLSGPGVTSASNTGYWLGGADDLGLVAREGEQAPDLPAGVLWAGANFPGINVYGEIAFFSPLVGPGITPQNNHAIWSGIPGDLSLVVQRGQSAPLMPDGIVLSLLSTSAIVPVNQRHELAFRANLSGPGISNVNDSATYLYIQGAFQLLLQEGAELAQFGDGVLLGQGASKIGFNDVGDLVTASELSGPNVSDSNNKVAWLWRRGGWCLPLFRTGDVVDGRVLVAQGLDDLSPAHDSTGGGDAILQFMNDEAHVAALMSFSDGSKAIYRLRGSANFDLDDDGLFGMPDYSAFAECMSGPEAEATGETCTLLDVDLDGDVDLRDFGTLQEVFSWMSP